MKSIQNKAKQVSESNGLASGSGKMLTPSLNVNVQEGGAYASMMKKQQIQEEPVRGIPSGKGNTEKRLKERLLESVETLSYNKEYYNAISSLLALYSMGALTEGVLNTIDREDLREIKGIIREFKDILESF